LLFFQAQGRVYLYACGRIRLNLSSHSSIRHGNWKAGHRSDLKCADPFLDALAQQRYDLLTQLPATRFDPRRHVVAAYHLGRSLCIAADPVGRQGISSDEGTKRPD